MFTTKKIAVVSVINDLVTDNRVHKTCKTLIKCGYSVKLIGRKLPHSLPLSPVGYERHRMFLLFVRGPLFYGFFNVRLFFKLLFTKADLLYANDLDTLLPNYLVSRIKKIPIVYDSHELFCEVPELRNSFLKRKIWLSVERVIIPKLTHCITVNESIAKIYTDQYKIPFSVVRNIPESGSVSIIKDRSTLGLPLNKKILLMQGAGINIDRGAEELVDAMHYLQDCILLIIGSGDVWPILKEKLKGGLAQKVILIDRIPREELLQYTHVADLGISIDKNTNLNYYYSLPNKIFDYIHAGVPVLASKLPEIEKIITTFQVGEFIPNHTPEVIADTISKLINSPRLKTYKENTVAATGVLNWKTEELQLINVLSAL